MTKSIFEVHNLEDASLPALFHRDTVRRGDPSVGNWHENIEILYCAGGQGQILCSGVEHDIYPGDLFVVNSNEVHCSKSRTLLDRYCLIVDSAFLAENHLPTSNLEFEHSPNDPASCAIYRQLIDEFESNNPCRDASIRVLVLRLVLQLTRFHAFPQSNQVLPDDTIKLAIGYLQSNYARHISLDEVSHEVGLSKYHFSRKFKSITGMTMVEYLNTVRCQNAKNLLQKRKYSIDQVAIRCGFKNTSYFSRIFKQTTGFPPSAVSAPGR